MRLTPTVLVLVTFVIGAPFAAAQNAGPNVEKMSQVMAKFRERSWAFEDKMEREEQAFRDAQKQKRRKLEVQLEDNQLRNPGKSKEIQATMEAENKKAEAEQKAFNEKMQKEGESFFKGLQKEREAAMREFAPKPPHGGGK